MTAMTDWELLGRFAREGAQDAFAELVSRHLNFVYSSARRQLRSPQLVEELTQSVFLELAQNAAKLDPRTPLTAWLYVVTRRTALNTLRTELRRQDREHTAYELTAMNSSPSVWAQVEPLLEEALDDLNSHDRSAVLLRYFENKSLRDVGAALGTTEDAAQKRVSRALDQVAPSSPSAAWPSPPPDSRPISRPMRSRPRRWRSAQRFPPGLSPLPPPSPPQPAPSP